jgi:hypothetical protein
VWSYSSGGILILARKDEGPKQVTTVSAAKENANFVNQQNAGTINNIFLGPPSSPPHPSGEAVPIPNTAIVPQGPKQIETLIEVIRKYKDEADKRGEHIDLLSQIMMKWSQLQQSAKLLEQFRGRADPEANRAIDKEWSRCLEM